MVTKIMPKRYTLNEFKERATKIHNNFYSYDKTVYKNKRTKVLITCPIHGDFEQSPDSHCNGRNGCFKCGQNIPTTFEFIQKAKEVHSNFYNYDKVLYKNSHEFITITCPIHGDFQQKAYTHLNGHGCAYCSGSKSTTEMFINESSIIHNNYYDYSLVNYINANTKVKIICSKHGVFEQSPHMHKNNKNGCPSCKQSKGEHTIENYLLNKNIVFIKQHKFNDCKNISYLKFDFYIPELNLCIEYDGIQHFEPVDIFGGEEQFKKQKINDRIKNEYCKLNNIHLLRIAYYESIEDKLNTIKVK